MKQFGLKQVQVDAICHCFSQYPAIDQVILYGSRAKGNFKDGSDIDLTIIDTSLETGLSFSEFLELENMLDDLLLPYKIDLSLKRQITNMNLIDHIERVGKVIYLKNSPAFIKE